MIVAGHRQLPRGGRGVALNIRTFGDPVLKSRAIAVEEFDDSLRRLAGQMLEMLRAEEGRAVLAANQVGLLERVFVAEMGDEEYVVVKPVIEERTQETEIGLEGCLSIPGIWVERHEGVAVSGQDADGEPISFAVSGLVARMMQHEVDHLDGILMLDRTDRESRQRAMRERLLAQNSCAQPTAT
jgi:peptide deformylase